MKPYIYKLKNGQIVETRRFESGVYETRLLNSDGGIMRAIPATIWLDAIENHFGMIEKAEYGTT